LQGELKLDAPMRTLVDAHKELLAASVRLVADLYRDTAAGDVWVLDRVHD
jgi:hypothetical protein